ncbi:MULTISPECIES: TetR family transcriptional regulator [Serratia]|uniref:Transcriptional regulator, TetR family n=1 Tax=Serratia proteamaculans (strain 568) TaxID=399741 RepID=A8GES4_SERP5|nr:MULTISPECIES: TetR family transcriptional regulator [Serratia]MCS4265664.1 AcrR family transcriptional regulator [Serratia sp. BIGb0163]RYM60654.1 TetR family transcriptional regulator [Serratia proteamaculans]
MNNDDLPATKRKNDPVGLKQRIFAAALAEFAEAGLKGARMENIAEHAATTKRMVVYHFKTKESLYLEVLEHVYQHIRAHETGLDLQALAPVAAMTRLVEESFNYHAEHPDFIRVICMENMMRGQYIRQSSRIKALNQSALTLLEDILQRGKQEKLFTPDASAADVHRLISSLCFHYVANQYTFNALFESHQPPEDQVRHIRQLAVVATLRYLAL